MVNDFATIDALIPARGGSKRVPGKNMKLLAGDPLLYYTLDAAKKAGIFRKIVVSTDDFNTAAYVTSLEVAVHKRPIELALDKSPDVDWIANYLNHEDKKPDFFMILRPTSPFRTAETILRAWDLWKRSGDADSLRAVSPVKQHPGKMWRLNGDRMIPLMNYPTIGGHDTYNLPTQLLPEVYVQNGSLEIGQTRNVLTRNTVSGWRIVPFHTHDLEGFDINDPIDFTIAEYLLANNQVAKL